MTDLHRSTPAAVISVWPWAAMGLVGSAIAALGLHLDGAATPPSSVTALSPVVAIAAPAAPPAAVVEAAAPSVAPPLWFVFDVAGTGYLRLTDLADAAAVPAHAAPRLLEHDHVMYALADLTLEVVPPQLRGWLGREVLTDGDCHARITGFAVVSRLIGSPAYANTDGDAWTAANVFEQGGRVLAARLDGCHDRRYARDVAAPAVVVPAELRAPRLAARARRALLASPAAKAAQQQWHEAGAPGSWRDDAAIEARVLRHPTTGVTWVVVFARTNQDDCASPDLNLLGVFQVGASGELQPVVTRLVEELHRLDRVLDVDGDGTLELLGQPWLGLDWVLLGSDGQERDRLSLPFFDCPC